jgi:hypothetical protein
MVGEPHYPVLSESLGDRVLDFGSGFLVVHGEYLLERPADRLLACPTRQRFGNAVQERDLAAGIRRDDCIANAPKRDFQPIAGFHGLRLTLLQVLKEAVPPAGSIVNGDRGKCEEHEQNRTAQGADQAEFVCRGLGLFGVLRKAILSNSLDVEARLPQVIHRRLPSVAADHPQGRL